VGDVAEASDNGVDLVLVAGGSLSARKIRRARKGGSSSAWLAILAHAASCSSGGTDSLLGQAHVREEADRAALHDSEQHAVLRAEVTTAVAYAFILVTDPSRSRWASKTPVFGRA